MFLLLGAVFHVLIALADGSKHMTNLVLAVNLDGLSILGYFRVRVIVGGLLCLAELTPIQKNKEIEKMNLLVIFVVE